MSIVQLPPPPSYTALDLKRKELAAISVTQREQARLHVMLDEEAVRVALLTDPQVAAELVLKFPPPNTTSAPILSEVADG